MRVLSLTRYSRQGASSRLRSLQYFPALEAAGFEITHWPLFGDDYLQRLYARQPAGALQRTAIWRRIQAMRGIGRNQFDVIWLEKELLPWLPYALEACLLPRDIPLVIDYDDAIFHNYDHLRNPVLRAVLGKKIDRLMARADLVIGGNPYLCDRARQAGARRVEYLPTVIDLERYPKEPVTASASTPVRIGWMGTPVTAKFLQPLVPVLQSLAQKYEFEFCVVGGQIDIPGVAVTAIPWSEDSEVAALQSLDIGIMPLPDSPWERGKCGYKLIQYMACGKPVVASPVGVNRQLVTDGINGFCATNESEWGAALETLLTDAALRIRCGTAARERVEAQYCLQKTAPLLIQWLGEVARS